jgi:hypothetical protein
MRIVDIRGSVSSLAWSPPSIRRTIFDEFSYSKELGVSYVEFKTFRLQLLSDCDRTALSLLFGAGGTKGWGCQEKYRPAVPGSNGRFL